jgi:hypothetical protein
MEQRKLGDMIEAAGVSKIEQMQDVLKEMTRSDLERSMLSVKVVFDGATESGNPTPWRIRLKSWLCNVECTRRGIPPSLRTLPDLNDDDRTQIEDLFAIDLQWLSARYPDHQPLYTKWNGLWKRSNPHSTIRYVSQNYPRREMYWMCKGLSISPEQQRELSLIKRVEFSREVNRLTAEKESVRNRLSMTYHARGNRYKTDDHNATIKRRLDIWFVGSLADWKPQRTADLYRAKTGESITRQLAANLIQQVHRDIPESKPEPRCQRAKKRRSVPSSLGSFG